MYRSRPRAFQGCNLRLNDHCHSVAISFKKLLFSNVEFVRVRFIDLQRGVFDSVVRVGDGNYAPAVWHEAVRLGLV
jgi:hypothetical protein